MRIHCIHKGREKTIETEKDRLVLGRPGGMEPPDVDLTPDLFVSRHHATLRVAGGRAFLKDLGSRFGTFVNGSDIRPLGEWQLAPDDTVQVGETVLRLELGLPAVEEPPPAVTTRGEPQILTSLSDTQVFGVPTKRLPPELARRLSLLVDLPLELAKDPRLDQMLGHVLKRMKDALPAVQRGAVLLCKPETGGLQVQAHLTEGELAYSATLAQRVIQERHGFIWHYGAEGDISQSVRELRIMTGMYAPLHWQGRTFGVICLDTSDPGATFGEEDLWLLIAVAHYAAAAIASQLLQEELRENSRALERLLTSFSPQLRGVLLERARAGKLRAGGEKSEVSILFCDIRNFTALSAPLATADIVDLLNDYFTALVRVVFEHDGTVDKFIGDGLLAVFGSPERDERHAQKAVAAAQAMQHAVAALNRERAARGETTCEMGIGLHCGEVLHGFIGAPDRLEFTVIGSAVNLACRYCQEAGDREILLSPQVYQRVFKEVTVEKRPITTKEGELTAYLVTGPRNA